MRTACGDHEHVPLVSDQCCGSVAGYTTHTHTYIYNDSSRNGQTMGALEIAHTHMYICIHVYMYVTAKGALHKTLIQHGRDAMLSDIGA